MTDAELITDEIVEKARATARYYQECTSFTNQEIMRQVILAIQDDIVRPYHNLFMGWKRDAIAYQKALEEIRYLHMGDKDSAAYQASDAALKGKYHEEGIEE